MGADTLPLPRVAVPGGTAIGGDQSWLYSPSSQRTCCGGVSMVNILCSLTGRTGPMSREEYLDIYYSCFDRSRALAGFVPFASGYAGRLRKILSRRGISVKTRISSPLTVSPEAALRELQLALDLGLPAALQNWFGCTEPVRPWHWVTVIGVDCPSGDPKSSALLVSSWGRVYRYPLLSVWRGKASLVTLTRKQRP